MPELRNIERMIISRTDSIGDVVLTLPLCGWLKAHHPGLEIIFLGRGYTRPVIENCKHCDRFMDWDALSGLDVRDRARSFKSINAGAILHVFPRREIAEAAKRASIPHRIGTAGRVYHWGKVNHCLRFSRKRSGLHEAQLNFNLLRAFGFRQVPSLQDIPEFYGLKIPEVSGIPVMEPGKKSVILHPGSKGSAREWGMTRFAELIRLLKGGLYNIFITGTEDEGKSFRDLLVKPFPYVKDVSGQVDLEGLMAFIAKADVLVAASTGPLHLAAAYGKRAIGIYPPIRPMHPGRWAPLGKDTRVLVVDRECNDCRDGSPCHCMHEISAEMVLTEIDREE